MSAGKLIDKETRKELKIGDKVFNKEGKEYTVYGWRKPHKVGSTGKVFVKAENSIFESRFFPSVFNLEIIDYED